jgi:hypothetical protein
VLEKIIEQYPSLAKIEGKVPLSLAKVQPFDPQTRRGFSSEAAMRLVVIPLMLIVIIAMLVTLGVGVLLLWHLVPVPRLGLQSAWRRS